MKPVALYVDLLGPYPKLIGLKHCYTTDRDARTYQGKAPVVAHPPCGPWSRSLEKLHTHPEEAELAYHALDTIRRVGGVLEHPRGSRFFDHAKLPRPSELPLHGGFTIEVQQCDWGHPARKRTWLHIIGLKGPLPPMPSPRKPTHWASGSRTNPRGPVPQGIKVCSAEQRRRTPQAFAEWLIAIASRCSR